MREGEVGKHFPVHLSSSDDEIKATWTHQNIPTIMLHYTIVISFNKAIGRCVKGVNEITVPVDHYLVTRNIKDTLYINTRECNVLVELLAFTCNKRIFSSYKFNDICTKLDMQNSVCVVNT